MAAEGIMDSKNASITTKQDLAALFQAKICDGLKQKGFRAMPYSGQPGEVFTVEIRQLDYSTDMRPEPTEPLPKNVLMLRK